MDNLGKKLLFTIFFILLISNLTAQEIGTTTIQQEFVNPLPKDKFVFLEIKEKIEIKTKNSDLELKGGKTYV